VSETKNANQKAGLTADRKAGATSLPTMKHGEETPAMLLALLNSPLESMINSQQARIMGVVTLKNGHKATVVFFYDIVPTANSTLEPVGTLEAK